MQDQLHEKKRRLEELQFLTICSRPLFTRLIFLSEISEIRENFSKNNSLGGKFLSDLK